jgi:hypothetical protein
MASGMNVSLRDLMTGVLNGRYDRVTEDDLVHGDKGDPLFFRLDPDRAYSLFGEDLREVEQDMSTVENMSTSGGEEADPTVRSNEGSRPPLLQARAQRARKRTRRWRVQESTGGSRLRGKAPFRKWAKLFWQLAGYTPLVLSSCRCSRVVGRETPPCPVSREGPFSTRDTVATTRAFSITRTTRIRRRGVCIRRDGYKRRKKWEPLHLTRLA